MDKETKEYLDKILKRIELLDVKIECLALEMKTSFSKQSIQNSHNFLMFGSDPHRDGDIMKKIYEAKSRNGIKRALVKIHETIGHTSLIHSNTLC